MSVCFSTLQFCAATLAGVKNDPRGYCSLDCRHGDGHGCILPLPPESCGPVVVPPYRISLRARRRFIHGHRGSESRYCCWSRRWTPLLIRDHAWFSLPLAAEEIFPKHLP